MKVDLPKDTFLNVNFPNCELSDVAQAEVTSQGRLEFGLKIEAREDARSKPYFWLKFSDRGGHFRDGTDIQALKENRISVTPLKIDMTDYTAQARLLAALGKEIAV